MWIKGITLISTLKPSGLKGTSTELPTSAIAGGGRSISSKKFFQQREEECCDFAIDPGAHQSQFWEDRATLSSLPSEDHGYIDPRKDLGEKTTQHLKTSMESLHNPLKIDENRGAIPPHSLCSRGSRLRCILASSSRPLSQALCKCSLHVGEPFEALC